MNKLFGILLLTLVFNVSADTLKNITDTRNLSDKMVKHFILKEFQKGINIAKPYWPLAPVELDSLVNQIEGQWPIVDQRFGKAIDSDFVKKEVIGSSFIRYYYLHKFQKHAIYWQITFYKPKDEWVLNNLLFLDTLDTLFELQE
ncbi:MAG: hypothetical protein COA86_18865 [Kangiella sp.]|nr:MAG: hypothetical protein COA86_18955 [Kangiella sp.]PHS11975.1 MAG: hypothetical protein COA86_18865 [Kangiella sp.]